MYFVDRKKMEKTCEYISECLNTFNVQEKWDSHVLGLSLERIAQVVIESIIDVGNDLIDGFIMRDPGSYEDIIDILVDERVVPKDEEAALKALVGLRKQLVSEFISIDHSVLHDRIKEHFIVLERFPHHVKEYVDRELGPVSAFIPDNN